MTCFELVLSCVIQCYVLIPPAYLGIDSMRQPKNAMPLTALPPKTQPYELPKQCENANAMLC